MVARLLSVVSVDSKWNLRGSVLSLLGVDATEKVDHLGQRRRFIELQAIDPTLSASNASGQ